MNNALVPKSGLPICPNCKTELREGEVIGLASKLGGQSEPTVTLVTCAHCHSVLGAIPLPAIKSVNMLAL
jgi:hypothetical protein